MLFAAFAYASGTERKQRKPYGVFLSIDSTEAAVLADYDTVVIDAQYFSAEDIAALHSDGHKVYSYLNVGSVEDFRSYYEDFRGIFLGGYENWEEEQWVDASSTEWQDFIIDSLASGMLEKGVDGFFVDNCDVYYYYDEDGIYDGLESILRRLKLLKKDVIINSGDIFLDEYFQRNGRVDDIITGINQETVFSSIDFISGTFSVQNADDSEYRMAYIEKYADMGAVIYLLEYTSDKRLVRRINSYCDENGFLCYVSDSIELD